MSEKVRCEAEFSGDGPWGWLHKVQCSKAAKVERDGKHYCTIHDPEYKAAKDKERQAAWDAKWVRQVEDSERRGLISEAFLGVSLDQIRERKAAGQCPCCGRSA
jgi:hypothetical protein